MKKEISNEEKLLENFQLEELEERLEMNGVNVDEWQYTLDVCGFWFWHIGM